MTVNATKGNSIPTRDPGGPSAIGPVGASRTPSVIHALDFGAIPAGSDPGSTYTVVDAPSNAIISPTSLVQIPNLGAGVTLNFGDTNYPTGLWNGQAASAAAEVRALVNKQASDFGKPLWLLLGYAADPKTALRLTFVIQGATTANAGAIGVHIHGAVA